MIERGKPLWEGSGGPHSCQAWSRQTWLLESDDRAHKDLLLQKYGERIEKLSQQDKLSNFVWTQDSWQRLMSDSTSWQKTLKNSHSSQMQLPVVSTLCQETKKHLNQKVGSEGTPKIGPVLEVATCCLHGKYGVENRIMFMNKQTILTHGSDFLMAGTSWSRIWTTTNKKPQKCSSKNMRWCWMRVILQADQRPKRNHKDENLPALAQELYLSGKELGPMLNQENIRSPILKCRRN